MLEFLHDHSRLRFDFDPVWIDCDNSASWYCELYWNGHYRQFTYRRIKSPTSYSQAFAFSYAFRDRVVDAFALLYAGTSGSIRWRSKVAVYSSFFAAARLDPAFGLDGLREFLDRNFEVSHDSLWRCDVCLDVSASLPQVVGWLFDKVEQFHSQIGKDSVHEGFAQTYYTDEIQNSKNRNRLFRVYDKILDSFKKGKTWLFPHLVGSGEVRRVELELRPDYCQRLARNPLDLVSSNELLANVFLSNLADYSTAVLPKVSLLAYKRADSMLPEAFCELGHLPSLYVSRASGYLRKVREAAGMYGIFQLVAWARKVGHSQSTELTPFELVRASVDFSASFFDVPLFKLAGFLRKLAREIDARNLRQSPLHPSPVRLRSVPRTRGSLASGS